MKLIAIEIDDDIIAEMEAVTEEARIFEPQLVAFARRAYRISRRFSDQLSEGLHPPGLIRGEFDWCSVAERCAAYRDFNGLLGRLYGHVYAINDGGPEKPAPPWVIEEDERLS